MTDALNTTIDRVHAALDYSAFVPVIFAAIIGLFITATIALEDNSANVASTSIERSEG